MSPSFDCAGSSLLCAEDNESIFDDNGCYGTVEEESGASWNYGNHRIFCENIGFDGGDGGMLPVQSEECLALMVEKEGQHLPRVDYLQRLRSGDLDLGDRKQAADWIGKVHARFGFGPLCGYLSINYLDRFLSSYELPKGKAWMMQLLAVACLSLAAKMEETEVPLSLDLQVDESKFVFEGRTIKRMELLVLSTLSWRMQSITPFSFIDHFLNKINNDRAPPRSSILRSVDLISSTIKGIDFLEFRPSEIAAAVAIAVGDESKTVSAEQAISALTQYVKKERVIKCVHLIHDLPSIGGSIKPASASLQSVPPSPIGVLDAACLSCRSDDTTAGSCANTSQNTPDNKRRKLSGRYES